ncbi:MAG: PepSY-associated TM helix domain-containing protein [Pseudomonadota bacterium]
MATRMSAKTRAAWMRRLHQWHWVSSALCLVGMLAFAITGITLNNAAHIEATPQVRQVQTVLPEAMRLSLSTAADTAPDAPLPAAAADWIRQTMAVDVHDRAVEWSDDEAYVSLPRPGGDAWLSIDRAAGTVEYERTDRGWIAYFNDLHKGRHTGTAWSWFIDVFSLACVVFCLTGLVLLKLHGKHRPATWPVVGTGALIPLLLALLLIH